MKRHAHMVDLLRPTLTFEEQTEYLEHKRELTEQDLNKIIENAEMIKKTAETARIKRYGK